MKIVFSGISKLLVLFSKICDRLLMYIHRSSFNKFGVNALYHPLTSYVVGLHNISLGDYSTIGPKATIYAYDSPLIIGRKCGIGPAAKIITGNHNTHVIGKLYKDYQLEDKLPDADLPVVLKDDVWVGAGVTILTGVTLERGVVIGAGSVVTKSIPPYCIAVGIPAKVVKIRWTIEEILEHEKIAYSPDDRFTEEVLREKLNKPKEQPEMDLLV